MFSTFFLIESNQGINALDSIQKNIINLLNTKKEFFPAANDYPLVKKSIIQYGVRDFSYVDVNSDEKEITKYIKDTIINYETRLDDVDVKLISAKHAEDFNRYFTVTGKIRDDDTEYAVNINLSLECLHSKFNVDTIDYE